MDFHPSGHPTETATPLSPVVLNCLLRGLAAALPLADLPPEVVAETREAAREMVLAFQPRSAMEVAAAIRAVAAHFASMDMYARAARPGMSDETALRLRSNANACARACDASQRAIINRPAAAPSEPLQANVAASDPAPAEPGIQPRDHTPNLNQSRREPGPHIHYENSASPGTDGARAGAAALNPRAREHA